MAHTQKLHLKAVKMLATQLNSTTNDKKSMLKSDLDFVRPVVLRAQISFYPCKSFFSNKISQFLHINRSLVGEKNFQVTQILIFRD